MPTTPPPPAPDSLALTAQTLVAPAKGILAADESGPTIEKRFRALGLANTEPNRRAYRELLLTAPGLGAFISGVILYDETLRQSTAGGIPFTQILQEQGIIPGIKVDLGAKPLAGFPGEKITEGLDGLRERLADYARLGARFTKWRAVLTLGPGLPTRTCLAANAEALARFAALSQEAGLVPLVEPETLMDGDHPLDRHLEATTAALTALFTALAAHRVRLDGLLLKVNMVLSGATATPQAPVAEVAAATLACLRATVPPTVAGIVFLSGGQTDLAATAHLDALHRLDPRPWPLSFSYGRALQNPALKIWSGSPAHVSAAQKALLHRARCNSAARQARYTSSMESQPA